MNNIGSESPDKKYAKHNTEHIESFVSPVLHINWKLEYSFEINPCYLTMI